MAWVLIHLGVLVSLGLCLITGIEVPFCVYFFHHSPGPEQMVWLCWLSSLLLCFHGNMGHRDHLCLGLFDSILWQRTSALWAPPPCLPTFWRVWECSWPWKPESFQRPFAHTSHKWLWTGLKREGKRWGTSTRITWLRLICSSGLFGLFAPQPASIIAGYCLDVKRDASKVVSAHQTTDI